MEALRTIETGKMEKLELLDTSPIKAGLREGEM